MSFDLTASGATVSESPPPAASAGAAGRTLTLRLRAPAIADAAAMEGRLTLRVSEPAVAPTLSAAVVAADSSALTLTLQKSE